MRERDILIGKALFDKITEEIKKEITEYET